MRPSRRSYPPGVVPEQTRPGDLVFVRRDALLSKLIGFGQRRVYGLGVVRRVLAALGLVTPTDRERAGWAAHFTHVACVVGVRGQLVEALGHGVERTNLERYRNVDFVLVNVHQQPWDRMQMAHFAHAVVGRRYGYIQAASLGLGMALRRFMPISFARPGTLICSVTGAQMLCRGSAVLSVDPSWATPADLAYELGVHPPAVAA